MTPLLLLAGSLMMTVERNIPYAEPANERQMLDVYKPEGAGERRPVVIWIHGGGWMAGRKEMVDHKPEAFTARGFVFVSINYRFIPQAKMGEIIRDVARATAWVHRNIARHGGDPARLFLMGHSAGAQLAAIVAVDHRYLEEVKVPPRAIIGCVPVDGDTYDVPLQVATAVARRKSQNQPAPKWGHPEKFGTLAEQRDYSAVTHIARGKRLPPFLIVHVADHTDVSAQAWRLWAALDQAGVAAKIVGAEATDHSKLDRDLGLPDDPPTKALFAFTADTLSAVARGVR